MACSTIRDGSVSDPHESSEVELLQACCAPIDDLSLQSALCSIDNLPLLRPHFVPPSLPLQDIIMTTNNTSRKINVPDDVTSIKTNRDKADAEFRIYDETTSEPRVVQHYKDMRAFQTVAFYRKMEQKYSFDKGAYRRLMTMEEALDELEHYIVRESTHSYASFRLQVYSNTTISIHFLFPGCFRPRLGPSQ